jgi:hypothetical protein
MSFAEFSYQLLQAHDFQHLYNAIGCTIQLGGSDQYGNIVAGLDLIHRTTVGGDRAAVTDTQLENSPHERAFGITTPLLTTAAGEKFGKSAGNAVWLDEKQTSAYEFWQVRNCPFRFTFELLQGQLFMLQTTLVLLVMSMAFPSHRPGLVCPIKFRTNTPSQPHSSSTVHPTPMSSAICACSLSCLCRRSTSSPPHMPRRPRSEGLSACWRMRSLGWCMDVSTFLYLIHLCIGFLVCGWAMGCSVIYSSASWAAPDPFLRLSVCPGCTELTRWHLCPSAAGVTRANLTTQIFFSTSTALTGLSAQDVLAAVGSDKRVTRLPKAELLQTPVHRLAAGYGLVDSVGSARRLMGTGGLYVNDVRYELPKTPNPPSAPTPAVSSSTSVSPSSHSSDTSTMPTTTTGSKIPNVFIPESALIDGRIAILRAGKGARIVLVADQESRTRGDGVDGKNVKEDDI